MTKAIRRLYCVPCELKQNSRNGSVTEHFEALAHKQK